MSHSESHHSVATFQGGNPEDRRFRILPTTLVVANEVVELDDHIVYLPANKAIRDATWHFEEGPKQRLTSRRRDSLLRESRQYFSASPKNRTDFRSGGKWSAWFAVGGSRTPVALVRVQRSRDERFSTVDLRLLNAVGELAWDAYRAKDGQAMLERIRLFFIDGRTYLQDPRTPQEVLEAYLEKTECICHPEVIDGGGESSHRVYGNAKLINSNGMAMHMQAFRPANSRSWTVAARSKRYATTGSSSFASKVFECGDVIVTNCYPKDCPPGFDLVPNLQSHISAPIVAGNGREKLGVLTIETTRKDAYSAVHGHAVFLLAAHAARPLGRALDRELARRRSIDAELVADGIISLLTCNTWKDVQLTLRRSLERMGYRRGMFSRVDHQQGLVIGDYSWGQGFRELSSDTRRGFITDRRDCQVEVALSGVPKRVPDPDGNPSAAQSAVFVANLQPFVVLPIILADGKVHWTLHIERGDIAPIADPEEIALLQLCRDAARAVERIEARERQELQFRLDRFTIEWTDDVLTQLARPEFLFQVLATFLAEHGIAARCTVLRSSSDSWEVICREANGRPKDQVQLGATFRHPRGSTIRSLRKSTRAVLVRGPESSLQYEIDGFPSIRQGGLDGVEPLELPASWEWVEMPLHCEGRLKAIVVLEKLVGGKNALPQWCAEELRFLTDISRITSQALGRLALEEQLERECLYALSMTAFRHEVDHSIIEIRDAAEALSDIVEARNLEQVANQEMDRIEKVQEFFRSEILIDDPGPRYVMISDEIDKAIELLPHNRWRVVIPRSRILTLIPGGRRPLCLILLQLLTNALKAVDHPPAYVSIGYQRLAARLGHRLTVEDHGRGFSLADFAVLSKTPTRLHVENWQPRYPAKRGGVGLTYARMVACRFGWSIRLTSRKEPTQWTIEFPETQL